MSWPRSARKGPLPQMAIAMFFRSMKGDKTNTDGELLYDAIQRRLKASNVGPDAKRDKLMSEFAIIKTSARLNEVNERLNKTPLKFYIEF